MSASEVKPTRWYYVLAILIPIFACLGTPCAVSGAVPSLPGALEVFRTEKLTQVVVPGSAEIRFPKAGAYAVYYEYRTNIAGVSYALDPRLPDMECRLISEQTGEAIPLAPSTVKGDVYTHQDRAGVMFKRFSLDQPGLYQFSCRYPYGGSSPQRVMAVGPNLVWEFFNVALKPVAAVLAGALAFAAACGVSMLIVGIVAYKRHRANAQPEGSGPGH